MRIGMILDAPFPPDNRVEKEAIALVSEGFEVFLFCLSSDGAPDESYKGFEIRRYRSNRIEYKLSALAYTVPFYHQLIAPKIDDFIKKNQIGILHVHDMVIAEAAFQAGAKHGCGIVLDLHENRPEIMKEYRHLNRFPGKFLINLDVWNAKQIELVNRADKVVVVTDLARRDLVRSTNKVETDIIVVPNTPSLDFLEYRIDEDLSGRMKATFNLLYVGDTSERRGTATALQMVKLLENEIPELCLWIVGTSSYDRELHELADRLGVKNRVRFEGWQSESLFPTYISRSQICLSPLKRNIHHDTTYANKVFQYMSIGRPSVVSDCTAQAELVRDTKSGLVYDASSVDEFAKAILMLYENKDLRDEFGVNARRAIVEEWNWEKTSKPLIDLYHGFYTR